jgi:xanthine dehydrogenase molybdenum-binding subunit
VEHSTAQIKFNEDASVNLSVFPAPIGTNAFTSMAQVAAEVLGLAFEDVHVVWGDTDTNTFEIGSCASRSMYIIGNAVKQAAVEARGKLLKRAAAKLGVPAEQLDIKDKNVFVTADPQRTVPVAQVVKEAIYTVDDVEQIVGSCSSRPNTMPPPYQALFVDVEVDTETGEVTVQKMVIANDSGRSINPMIVEGQMEGGAAQGLGYAIWEEPLLDAETGRLMTDDFDTYKIASALDMPDMDIMLLEQPEPTGPFGAKGAGEPGCVNQAAAIANAVYDAVGIRIWELPITPEKVLKALKAKQAT